MERRVFIDAYIVEQQCIDDVRCLLCLAHFATWQSNPSLRSEAFVLQNLLVQALRLGGLEETTQSLHDSTWEQWSQHESERRTKLLAFCFLGTESIAYDAPPSIWCDELALRLPCSCPEWTAPDSTTWSILRENTTPGEQGRFHETLGTLLSPESQVTPSTSTPTPVGNYVLMHGLLQKILWTSRFIAGNLSLTSSSKGYQSNFE